MTNLSAIGTGVVTSDGGAPSTLATRRAQNIANYLKGPQIPAPAWVTLTVYAVNQIVTVGGGQHLICSTAGTSGATIPTYGIAALTGRPITDGSVTWYGLPIVQTLTDPNGPTLTTGTNAAALGLTQVNTMLGSGQAVAPAAKLTGFGANLWGNGFAVGGWFAATGLAASGGNAPAVAAGQNAVNAYNIYDYEFEFYVTDSYFGLCMASGSLTPPSVEIDGVLVTANGVPSTGGSNYCFGYNYNGVVKRRLVRVMCGASNTLVTGIALSPIGFLEYSDTSATDNLLILGDSIAFTVTAGSLGSSIVHSLGGYLRRLLGISGVWNAAVGGAGYVSQNANTYNVGNVLGNAANIANIKALNPPHVFHQAGCNDVGNTAGIPAVVTAALQAWKMTRALLPNAKITIADGFPNATGPSVAAIALAVALQAAFTTWGDPNSRFIQLTSASASTAITQGTTNAGAAMPGTAGNTTNFISTDGTHPTPIGAWYYAVRVSQMIINAWNGAY